MGGMTTATLTRTFAAARTIEATKIYGDGDAAVRALDNVSVELSSGRFTAVMGPSGSGKSTLMHCIAGLDDLTAGQVFVGDVELGTLSDKGLTRLRRTKVGFVFQAFNLIPTLTALENITLPASLGGQQLTTHGSTAWSTRWGSRPSAPQTVGAVRRPEPTGGGGKGAGGAARDRFR